MIANIPLPVLEPEPPLRRPTAGADLRATTGLPRIEWRARHATVLHAGPAGCADEVYSLNLAVGCGHRCGFCSVRATPHYPGDSVVQLYAHTAERLHDELSRRRRLPRAVYISPATDPFPPFFEVQTETVRVVETLARHGVEAWLMTRGYIRPFALRRLMEVGQHVKVTVGVTTWDRRLQRTLEPLAAPPRLRLRQIAELVGGGVSVQAALEPLIPGLTDTQANLAAVLEPLAQVGVSRVSAGYLYLRPRIKEELVRALKANGYDPSCLNEYDNGPMLRGELAAARFLPKRRRQRGYAALMSIAAGFGITVRISGLTNPDFQVQPAKTDRPMLPRMMLCAS